MIDVVYGNETLSETQRELTKEIKKADYDGTLFIGYPILTSASGAFQIDALLTTIQKGIVAFDLSNLNATYPDGVPSNVLDQQDQIFSAIISKLTEDGRLVTRRQVRVPVNIVTISEDFNGASDGSYVSTTDNVLNLIDSFQPLNDTDFQILNSVIERTATLRPRKQRSDLSKANSKGNQIKLIEGKIANLDAAQKRAAIEFPDGPQRIRGLAGSGKTIVLAMKSSYLHLKNPSWRIALTFYTRSLYQQLTGLTRRFSFEFVKDEPDWNKLTILHAWGSSYTKGIYAEIAERVGAPVRNYQYARDKYIYGREFEGVVNELYEFVINNPNRVSPIYDAVLIDEAQDLPQKFFELIYMFTKPPHRIVYAYDELQTLNETEMPSPQELFGKRSNNRPRVTLANLEDRPKQDIVLPVCYRNTQWALTTAHGLGFGVKRGKGLVQMFEKPSTWEEIGYELVTGQLQLGRPVSLRRSASATPSFFAEILNEQDAVTFSSFPTEGHEYEALVASIKKNLEEDELEPDDILVIVSEIQKIRTKGGAVMRALAQAKIPSHIVGVTQSTDEVFSKSSVAITHIHRAKGNEAPMIYVVGADYCFDGFNIGTLRNVLFTAITRSKAWVRISGCGTQMDRLIQEFSEIRADEYSLDFRYPTKKELGRIKTRYRDVSEIEAKTIEADLESLSRLLPLIRNGRISLADLPEEVAGALRFLVNEADDSE
ncbi:RNA helicase [Mesorhizobium sp. B3-1-3]|uniref:DEAD/DEAH box helicase n=1 Tax=unclassified Mesorhizobium TaxID=325217 RepID=UPI001129C607|nr:MULTISPECIES: ATP-binding domain-containing protein [unclassified Mesorhizobium]TPI58456.1 RNA helicase [Mesorhizobium sp. B3-1-8]TPI67292.1 RNA helicase [Mesorhizobium sp. B3-1-3]